MHLQSRCVFITKTDMKNQTHYVTIEVKHRGDAKQIAELISQAAYSLSQVDDARVMAVGEAVVRPEAA